MNLSVGIVGLPNVGKSTLFNALLKKQQALAANYPFATVEPNVGIVPVPDSRLVKLGLIEKEENGMASIPPIVPATVKFVDIAGLVKGAAEGAGLGNKFLSHIREVDVVCHVVRAFSDSNILREGSESPQKDYGVIITELILADLATVEKALSNRKNPNLPILQKVADGLNKGLPARQIELTDEEKDAVADLFLLTMKPEMVVLNVSENDYADEKILNLTQVYANELVMPEDHIVVICAKVEEEMAQLSEEEQKEYLLGIGVKTGGLEMLIQKAYATLGLISFLTAGDKEVRAWTIKKGINAQNASGVIHTDFIKHFIKAEVVGFADFVQSGGWKKSRALGKTRFEGKDYVMVDGDVVEFKIGN